MNRPFIMKFPWKWALTLVVCVAFVFLFAAPAYADTDGTELQVTDQPEKLVIQLGPVWAGVEFELKTDAGIYPQPVVVSTEGMLTMELGGSKTYTLSAMNSSTAAPDPDTAATAPSLNETISPPENEAPASILSSDPQQTDDPGQAGLPNETSNPDEINQPDEENNNLILGIPNLHLFLFAGGLIGCIAGLMVMWVLKRRRNNRYDDLDDYDDDD